MQAEPNLAAGTLLQNYEICSILGVGGFGITYLAKHRSLGSRHAIKEYMPRDHAYRTTEARVVANGVTESVDSEIFGDGLVRFLEEARSLVRFRHPNIVRATDYFEANSTAYIVMEYAKGKTLGHWLKRQARLPDEETLQSIFLPLLDGLSEVHNSELLHRDIKPANIYLLDDGSPLLIDFGAARSALGATGRSRHIPISPGYSPKEQYASAKHQGPWTDVYSVGATLMRCITGKEPPSAPDRSEAFDNGEPDPMPEALIAGGARYSKSFLNTIDHCLAWDSHRRLQSVNDVRAGLCGEMDPGPRGRDGKFLGSAASPSYDYDVATRVRVPLDQKSTVVSPIDGRWLGLGKQSRVVQALHSFTKSKESVKAVSDSHANSEVKVESDAHDSDRLEESEEEASATGIGTKLPSNWVPYSMLLLMGLGTALAIRFLPFSDDDLPPTTSGVPAAEVKNAPQAVDVEKQLLRFDELADQLESAGTVIPAETQQRWENLRKEVQSMISSGKTEAAGIVLRQSLQERATALAESDRFVSIGSTAQAIQNAFSACQSYYGVDECVASWFEAERIEEIRLSPYLLDEQETSFGAFSRFVEATGYVPTASDRGLSLQKLPDFSVGRLDGYSPLSPFGAGSSITGHEDKPVFHISWFDADEYCRYRGSRLPTRAEWEAAARATPTEYFALYFDPAIARVTVSAGDVGSTVSTNDGSILDSETGLYGATGNVAEWTDSIDVSSPGGQRRIVKGGSVSDDALVDLRLAAIRAEYPGDAFSDIGIRCATDTEQWP